MSTTATVRLPLDPMAVRVRHVATDQMPKVANGAEQPPDEGVDRTLANRAPCPKRHGHPRPARRSAISRASASKSLIVSPSITTPPSVQGLRVSRQPIDNVVDDNGVLLPVVFRVRENEREEALSTELGQRPEVGRYAFMPGRHIRRRSRIVAPGRSPELDAVESAWGQAPSGRTGRDRLP